MTRCACQITGCPTMSIIVTSRGRSGDAFGKMGSVFVPMEAIMQSRATPAGHPPQQPHRLRPRAPQHWCLPSRMAMSPLVCPTGVYPMTSITAARLARSVVVYGRMDTACVKTGATTPSRISPGHLCFERRSYSVTKHAYYIHTLVLVTASVPYG